MLHGWSVLWMQSRRRGISPGSQASLKPACVLWRGDETKQLVALETRYRFRRVANELYEVRPQADETARDNPHLERLLAKPASRLRSLIKR